MSQLHSCTYFGFISMFSKSASSSIVVVVSLRGFQSSILLWSLPLLQHRLCNGFTVGLYSIQLICAAVLYASIKSSWLSKLQHSFHGAALTCAGVVSLCCSCGRCAPALEFFSSSVVPLYLVKIVTFLEALFFVTERSCAILYSFWDNSVVLMLNILVVEVFQLTKL